MTPCVDHQRGWNPALEHGLTRCFGTAAKAEVLWGPLALELWESLHQLAETVT